MEKGQDNKKRLEESLQVFIVQPSQDEGAYLLDVKGLSLETVEEIQQALIEQDKTGYSFESDRLVGSFRNSPRLRAWDSFLEPFRNKDQRPIKVRVIIEELENT